MTQVGEDLRKAVEILDARGWCQGAHEAPDGRVCAEAAVIRVVEGDRVRFGTEVRDQESLVERVDYVPGFDTWDFPLIQARHTIEPELIGYLYELSIGSSMHRVYDAFDALKQHMPEGEDRSVNRYNDDPMTSVEDVKLMFKRAIEAEEAKA